MRYLKKSAFVEAVRWLKPGDHPQVEPAKHYLHLSNDCRCYYVTYGERLSTGWLSRETFDNRPKDTDLPWMAEVVKIVDGAKLYYRVLYPFQYFTMQAVKEAPAVASTDVLVLDYQLAMGWGDAVLGCIADRRKDHSRPFRDIPVFPGDWVVDDGTQLVVFPDSEFHKSFDQA